MFLSFGLIIGVISIVVSMLVSNIKDISDVLPLYEQNLVDMRLDIDRSLGIDMMESARGMTGDFDFAGLLTGLLNTITSLIGNIFLILIYVIFLLFEQTSFRSKVNAFYRDKTKSESAYDLLGEIDTSMGSYITLKTLVGLITGVLSFIALYIIGVDFAFFWAFLIFLLNYIPNIGSLVATLFPAVIALLQFGEWKYSVYVLLSVGVIQVIVGNLLEPKILGNSLNVSSLVVLLALAFWGSIWGVVGMFLSVPITVMMIIIFAQFPATRGIAILLSEKGVLQRDIYA